MIFPNSSLIRRPHLLAGALLAAALTLSAQAEPPAKKAAPAPKAAKLDKKIGPWKNRFPNDQAVVGVWIQQYPDNSAEAPRYKGKHPCMVYYIFSDGRQHGFHYHADGTVESEVKSEAPAWVLENLAVVYQPDKVKELIKEARAKAPGA